MSRERMTGRILIVWEDTVGTVLTSDAAAGATVLNVDDVAPFNGATNDDGPGGWLQVGDQVVQYTGIDDDASTITLAKGLASAVTVGSETGDVLVWNDLYGEPDTVQWAEVKPSGKRNQADTIEAVVSDSIDGLANGDRGGPGETCTLVRDGDEWELTSVRGRPSRTRGVKFEADDFYVLTAADITAGAATFPLSHRPADEGMVAFWRTTPQEPTEYTVDYDAQTITWPLSGFEKAGDRLWVHYAYRRGFAIPTLVTPTFVDSASAVSPGGAVTVTIPATVQAGDLLIAMQGKQANGPGAWAAPSGWSLLTTDAVVEPSFKVAFSRVAAAGDAGSPITFTTGEPDSPLFGGAGVALAVYRNAQIAAISPVTAGSGAGMSGIATAASVTSPAEALVLGLWGATSTSSTGITPSDLTRAAALEQRGAAAISERAVSAGPSGTTTASVGGAGFACWQVALVQK